MSGICRDWTLTESIEVENYYNFIGSPEHAPKSSDYVVNGIVHHPSNPEMYARHTNEGNILRIHPENLNKAVDSAKRLYGSSIKKVVDRLDTSYPEYSSKDTKTINSYVKDSSINHRILAGDQNVPTEALDRVIGLHHAPDDMVVWSGTSAPHASVLRNSDVVHHPAFTSTSISPRAAESFANKEKHLVHGDIMKIHVPKGHPALYVRGGEHEGEREIILPRNTTLNIDRSKEQRMVTPRGEYRVHHCTIV